MRNDLGKILLPEVVIRSPCFWQPVCQSRYQLLATHYSWS